MIKVVKFFHPVDLDPLQVESWTLEDTIQSVKFVDSPYLRIYTPAAAPDDFHIKIQHILDLGFGDDPLWTGTETITLVDTDIPPSSIYDYNFFIPFDKAVAPAPVTRHVVYITNNSTTTSFVVKTLLFGKTDTQLQTSQDNGVITTLR